MSSVNSVLVEAARDGDMELIKSLFSRKTPLSTVEKMLKRARKSHKAAKDEDEEYTRRRFVFDLALLIVVDHLDSQEKTWGLATLCVADDWQNILWSVIRYTPWTSHELATLRTSTDKNWVHSLISAHLRDMTTGEMFASFNDCVRAIRRENE